MTKRRIISILLLVAVMTLALSIAMIAVEANEIATTNQSILTAEEAQQFIQKNYNLSAKISGESENMYLDVSKPSESVFLAISNGISLDDLEKFCERHGFEEKQSISEGNYLVTAEAVKTFFEDSYNVVTKTSFEYPNTYIDIWASSKSYFIDLKDEGLSIEELISFAQNHLFEKKSSIIFENDVLDSLIKFFTYGNNTTYQIWQNDTGFIVITKNCEIYFDFDSIDEDFCKGISIYTAKKIIEDNIEKLNVKYTDYN